MTVDQLSLIAQADEVLIPAYRRPPPVMRRGAGVELWDVAGNRYLDMTAGMAVCALGHAHPVLAEALGAQARQLLHVSNLYHIERQIQAAAAIVERCFGDKVFFCNSGAEANETALKLARRYQAIVCGKPERVRIVSTYGSFHGRSIATVSITGQEKYRHGFGPMFGPVEFVPFGDLDAASEALEDSQACAFIVEPVQGDGGILPMPPGYLAGLRQLAVATGTLLILDEVQTGMGRTGRWFGHQWFDATPDIMTLAKALGGGVPVGAVVTTDAVAEGLAHPGDGPAPHATTFGGNPLSCAAILAVFDVIERQELLAHCRTMGEYLGGRLQYLISQHPQHCSAARGVGLLQGLVLNEDATPIVTRCRERGLLLCSVAGNVLRFSPPLIVNEEQIDRAIAILEETLIATDA